MSIAHKILKIINKKKEISLSELSSLVDKSFNDHRDYYCIASLLSCGYLDTMIYMDSLHISKNNNKEIAVTLYTATFGKGKFEYLGKDIENDGDNSDQKFFITAKGEDFLQLINRRRIDFIYSIAVGIVVGIATAIFSSWLSSNVKFNNQFINQDMVKNRQVEIEDKKK